MKTVWTETKPEFHGEFVNFDAMMAWPKPVQKPHPPVIVGGGFPYGAKRAIEYGDGWMPLGGRGWDPLETMQRFRQMAAEADRDPDSLGVTIFGYDDANGSIQNYQDAGVERTVFVLPSTSREEALPLLDKYAALIS
jgi:alkanesulfonate monooxygenase SsuD/methylene tetrahydromethanopterin reductase-like flavin-dependent oxidoreductase (luciferase family)